LAKKRTKKRALSKPTTVRRRVVKRKPPVRRKPVEAPKHDEVREVASAILIIGILYFGIQGSMFIIFRTDSPMLAVVSNSMVPTFQRGDLIFVKGVDSISELKIHDIIVYQDASGKEIVHRIIFENIQDDTIITKGDANPGPDPPIKFDQVRGKVLFWIPRIGYISLWIRRE
jgi:signal peptidase I